MSGTEVAAILVVVIPSIGAALGYLLKASREAGRADEYRRTSAATIIDKNRELDTAHDTIADLRADLAECWQRRGATT